MQNYPGGKEFTLTAPAKIVSENNYVCLSDLLHTVILLANISIYGGKQCGPRSGAV